MKYFILCVALSYIFLSPIDSKSTNPKINYKESNTLSSSEKIDYFDYFEWDSDNGEFKKKRIVKYFYDEKENISEIHTIINENVYGRVEYIYDEFDNMVEKNIYNESYDYLTGWATSETNEYKYDDNGLMVERILEKNGNKYKYRYNYNNDNLIRATYYYVWDYDYYDWRITRKDSTIYDDYGNHIEYEKYIYDQSKKEFIIDQRYKYINRYQNDKLVSVTGMRYIDKLWQYIFKYIYEYNYEKVTSKTESFYYNDKWNYLKKDIFTYNQNKDINEHIQQEYRNNEFSNNKKYTFYYKNNIFKNELEYDNILVFPNPTHYLLYLSNTSEQKKKGNVDILDHLGNVISSYQNIIIDNIIFSMDYTSGIYYVKLYFEDKTIIKRIVLLP